MDRHMSDVEALMWTLEKDPHLASTFANITILDRSPDVERLRRRMERAVHAVPRLRQRVARGFGRLAPPQWVDEPDIDLDWHVRRVALPAPSGRRRTSGGQAPAGGRRATTGAADASERAALDLAASLAAEPFDRTRPLWRFTVIEGLQGGRAAMVQQIHHTITDGEGGVRMSVEFIDLERDAPEPPPLAADASGAAERLVADDLLSSIAASVGHVARRNLGIAQRAGTGLVQLVAHPTRIAPLVTGAGEAAASSVRQLVVAGRARSPLWTERTLRRRLEVLRLPLDDAKRAATALGGSVNDLFVAAVAGGAGAYHRDRGVDVDELRMAMPISTRTKGDRAANAFVPTRTLVSVDPDPRVRFARIHEQLAATKGEPAVHLASGLAGVANLLPTSVLVRAARSQVETVDFTTSNVRGAPFDLFIAGARIDANFPLGPIAGTAFNATVLSVAGSLDVGVHVDAGAVEDPTALRDAIADAAAELLSLG